MGWRMGRGLLVELAGLFSYSRFFLSLSLFFPFLCFGGLAFGLVQYPFRYLMGEASVVATRSRKCNTQKNHPRRIAGPFI